jgi:LysM repeat protein
MLVENLTRVKLSHIVYGIRSNHRMKLRREFVVFVPMLIVILTGCFRQASDSVDPINPVSNTAIPTIDTSGNNITLPITDTIPAPLTTDVEGPVIAVTQSTPIIPASNTPFPTMTEFSPVTTATTDLGSSSSVAPVPLVTETLPPTQITPGAPAGPGVVNTLPSNNLSGAQLTNTPSGLITPTGLPEPESDECIYIVNAGDNLFRIAINNDTTLDALRAANPQISGDLIQPGDRLNIPDCIPSDGSTAGGSSTIGSVPIEGGTGATTPTTTHIVQAGETLGVIARQYDVTIASIIQANSLTDPTRLSVGQELIIPNPSN